MSKHNIEIEKITFNFRVNRELISIVFTESSRTIVIFRGVTVYTSRHSVETVKQAEEMLLRYLESINIS